VQIKRLRCAAIAFSYRRYAAAYFTGFVPPRLPTKAHQLLSGALRLHEIKHDGFRVIARKNGDRVRLYSRPSNDLTDRFPQIVEALARLRPTFCIIDGEAVACGHDGVADFEMSDWRHGDRVFMYSFDLVGLNGDDLRRDPLVGRKATLARMLAASPDGIRFNEHLDEHDGAIVSTMRASWGWKASSPSARTRATSRGGRVIGSRARTRMRRLIPPSALAVLRAIQTAPPLFAATVVHTPPIATI
jgi:hypothetical protein